MTMSAAVLCRSMAFCAVSVKASLCASVTIGVGSLLLGGRIYCPMTVLFIPALLPMVPDDLARSMLDEMRRSHIDNIAACDKAKADTGWEQTGPLELSCQKEALCGGTVVYPCDNGEDIVHYTRVVYFTAEAGAQLLGLSWETA